MSTDFTLVYCTCPDMDTASNIANHLVLNKLAACVNILPNIQSIYTWQGNIEQAIEHLLMIKTRLASYTDLQQAILQLHPYELPEIISVPINAGLPNYLKWIDENVLP